MSCRFFESFKSAVEQETEHTARKQQKEKKNHSHHIKDNIETSSHDHTQSHDKMSKSCDLLENDVFEFSLFNNDVT